VATEEGQDIPMIPTCPDGFALIRAGSFLMGSSMGDANERPVRQRSVAPFCLEKTEARTPTGALMNNVTWTEARAVCRKRGQRLPAETEWEYAAKGTIGRIYPWGDRPPDCTRANFKECAGQASAQQRPAGSTPDGVLDLAGNLWEWVEDCYFSPDEARPKARNSCMNRVLRGGSWGTRANSLRSSAREPGVPQVRSEQVGFRCAQDVVMKPIEQPAEQE
jgi:formylglycine-generating enzyme required for sulfatase activity